MTIATWIGDRFIVPVVFIGFEKSSNTDNTVLFGVVPQTVHL